MFVLNQSYSLKASLIIIDQLEEEIQSDKGNKGGVIVNELMNCQSFTLPHPVYFV